MKKEIIHYSEGKEGITYCGYPYKIREFPDMRHSLSFTQIQEHITCIKCQKKLKEEQELKQNLKEYYKKIEPEINDSDDNFILGYQEAVSNLLGTFNNGVCADCPFCFETSSYDFESCQPEAILHCSLDKCWIDEVKKIIRN